MRLSGTGRLLLVLTLIVAAATWTAGAGAQVGGPVILGGDDLTSHGSVDTSTGDLQDGWLYIQKALENINPKVIRPNDNSVAALGSEASTDTCCDAGAGIGQAAAKVGLTVTYYNGEAAINSFFAALNSGGTNPKIIWIAGDDASNDLSDGPGDEPAALSANASSLDAFVNQGGGLMSHGTEYGWLSALLPGLTANDDRSSSGDLYLTPEGIAAFPGLTNDHVNAGPWHNFFQGNFGGLQILVRSGNIDDDTGTDAAVVLGGASVSLTVAPADVAITKTDAADPVTVGQRVRYFLTVTNNGPNAATNVTVTDTLPANVSAVATSTSQGTCSVASGKVICNLGTLASGASAQVVISAKTTKTGTLTNTASVAGKEPDPNSGNNSSTATTTVRAPLAPPTCRFTVRPTAIPAGEATLLRVTIRRAGAPLANRRVVLRGPGVAKATRTNNRGVVRTRITPSRAGILRIRVPGLANCTRRVSILGAVAGGQLTGRN
jgi:uncharacterized repeat protein (TIGR01451 family)